MNTKLPNWVNISAMVLLFSAVILLVLFIYQL